MYLSLFTCYRLLLMHVLYEKIDQILTNKLHAPMHYKIGVTCVYNGHVGYMVREYWPDTP